VTTWDTSLSEGTTVTLALAGTVNAPIHWGDGSVHTRGHEQRQLEAGPPSDPIPTAA
jgi:hypothetical protein